MGDTLRLLEFHSQNRFYQSYFVKQNIFPPDIERELHKSQVNPAASSCAEEHLIRVLRKYDPKKHGVVLVEEVPPGANFVTKDGRIFQKGDKLRKRYRCREMKTGLIYLFSALYEVKLAG